MNKHLSVTYVEKDEPKKRITEVKSYGEALNLLKRFNSGEYVVLEYHYYMM